MIISHEQRFIFIKTRKTAGSSLEIALSGVCGPEDIITPLSTVEEKVRRDLGFRSRQNYFVPLSGYDYRDILRLIVRRRRKQYYHHVPAARIRAWVGEEVWNEYFKFCFERNPWDKTVSDFYWSGGTEVFGSIESFLHSEESSSRSDFDLYSVNGIVTVDRVYRYEEIDQALIDISSRLALERPISMPSYRAKSSSRVGNAHYRDVMTANDASLVSVKFAREIRLLGYEF